MDWLSRVSTRIEDWRELPRHREIREALGQTRTTDFFETIVALARCHTVLGDWDQTCKHVLEARVLADALDLDTKTGAGASDPTVRTALEHLRFLEDDPASQG